MVLNVTLEFCPSDGGSGGRSCCDAADDAALQAQFDAMMGVKPDGACAQHVKSILCWVSSQEGNGLIFRNIFRLFLGSTYGLLFKSADKPSRRHV